MAMATDMSVKVGGRVFHPALPVVDAAFPTETEQSFQTSLADFVSANVPLESREGIQTRERVLDQMGVLCREWIRYVCTSKGLAADVIENAGGALYTSGSYRLGTMREIQSNVMSMFSGDDTQLILLKFSFHSLRRA